jgi:hypothetical protein
VQLTDSVVLNGGQPGIEGVGAGAVDHHLGERGDVLAEPVQVRADTADAGESGPLGVVEVFREELSIVVDEGVHRGSCWSGWL